MKVSSIFLMHVTTGNDVGSYLGDVWEFDFSTMLFTEMKLEGPDAANINRSNHTAIYYGPHDS